MGGWVRGLAFSEHRFLADVSVLLPPQRSTYWGGTEGVSPQGWGAIARCPRVQTLLPPPTICRTLGKFCLSSSVKRGD